MANERFRVNDLEELTLRQASLLIDDLMAGTRRAWAQLRPNSQRRPEARRYPRRGDRIIAGFDPRFPVDAARNLPGEHLVIDAAQNRPDHTTDKVFGYSALAPQGHADLSHVLEAGRPTAGRG